MDINRLFSAKRGGREPQSIDSRTQYQRDFDRVIFSSAFRRLQNKTQVFPLPGSVFVHNRLTHSLEVASVGRTLGDLIGNFIAEKYKDSLSKENYFLFQHCLDDVISTACLCHDIGNPAFGHSGEDAIANYFIKNENYLSSFYEEKQWNDFINFEGNANAIRILTHQQNGKTEGGIQLTYSTLASILKYPCESSAKNKKILNQKKFGFFQSERNIFLDVAHTTGMIQSQENPIAFKRHPFVWLVEVADDICYNIIDLEDAQRLGFISKNDCEDFLLNIITDLGGSSEKEKALLRLNEITDKNDRISYLRAKSIGKLVDAAVEKYKEYFDEILAGNLTQSIFSLIENDCPTLKEISDFSVENIYNHRSVIEIENAGYNVMYELLNHFIPNILKNKTDLLGSEKNALKLIPKQFIYENGNAYEKTLGVLDFVSGMTDNYATDLYKKIKGITIGMTV